MASSSHRHHQTLPPPKRPKIELPTTATQNQNPEPIPDKGKSVFPPSIEDTVLSKSTRLTRREVIHRRAHYMRQLTKCYKTHYWALMEELKVQYRDYVWRFGVVPFKGQNGNLEECEGENGNNNNEGEEGEENGGGGFGLCGFYGCKYKAMALTRFCHLHILADDKQLLYKPCTYVIKSAQAGAITCGKPILQATVPSLCNIHLPKAQAHFNRALRQAGLNISSSSKLAPKLHVLVAEYVREIQAKRKAAIREKDVVID